MEGHYLSQQPQQPPPLDYALPSRMGLRRAFKVILYFAGANIALFGLLGSYIFLTGKNLLVENVELLPYIIALVISTFIFIHRRYYAHCLRWIQYVWWILGATVGGITAIVLAAVLISHNSL